MDRGQANRRIFRRKKEHVEAFENYLTDVARSLKAHMIAEEASEDWVVDHGHGASSVAKDITKQCAFAHAVMAAFVS